MDKGFLTKSAFHLAKNIITTRVEQLLKKKKYWKKNQDGFTAIFTNLQYTLYFT